LKEDLLRSISEEVTKTLTKQIGDKIKI